MQGLPLGPWYVLFHGGIEAYALGEALSIEFFSHSNSAPKSLLPSSQCNVSAPEFSSRGDECRVSFQSWWQFCTVWRGDRRPDSFSKRRRGWVESLGEQHLDCWRVESWVGVGATGAFLRKKVVGFGIVREWNTMDYSCLKIASK